MKKAFFTLGTMFFLLIPLQSGIAQNTGSIPPISHGNILPGPESGETGSDYVEKRLIPKFVNALLVLALSISVLMLIVGGIFYLLSSGDSEMIKRAKDILTWAILGTAIALFAFAIVKFLVGLDLGG